MKTDILSKIHKQSLKEAGLKSTPSNTRNKALSIEDLGYKRRIKILSSTIESLTQMSHFNASKTSKPCITTTNEHNSTQNTPMTLTRINAKHHP
jgi:hypothetical protein